ncbi:hypothetical protein [Rathayibacter soli]|uniref:hypothetical protein n=1 Tax=Rathayibacter soli TaxID=3144168 RepID=UPI0027E59084|nr:hypothetical protein [Glaciibacter superstes]
MTGDARGCVVPCFAVMKSACGHVAGLAASGEQAESIAASLGSGWFASEGLSQIELAEFKAGVSCGSCEPATSAAGGDVAPGVSALRTAEVE